MPLLVMLSCTKPAPGAASGNKISALPGLARSVLELQRSSPGSSNCVDFASATVVIAQNRELFLVTVPHVQTWVGPDTRVSYRVGKKNKSKTIDELVAGQRPLPWLTKPYASVLPLRPKAGTAKELTQIAIHDEALMVDESREPAIYRPDGELFAVGYSTPDNPPETLGPMLRSGDFKVTGIPEKSCDSSGGKEYNTLVFPLDAIGKAGMSGGPVFRVTADGTVYCVGLIEGNLREEGVYLLMVPSFFVKNAVDSVTPEDSPGGPIEEP